MRREKRIEKKGEEWEDAKKAESAGENDVEYVSRRKKIRTNVTNAFFLPFVLSVQNSESSLD